MAAPTGPIKSGFKQGAGGYFTVLSTITPALCLSYAGTNGSGGSAVVGAFTADSTFAAQGGVNLVKTGGLLKDMGRTVVSSGRVFRKFQAVAPITLSTFGVGGLATTFPGYATTYLEVAAEGQVPAANLSLIARAF